MKRAALLLLSMFVWLPSVASGAPVRANQPTHARAFHRSGQTFVTWTEDGTRKGERYRVYRHHEPISAANLAGASRLYEVPEDSSRFYSSRHIEGATWSERYTQRYVIEDRAAPLAAGTGLLVWTLDPRDFGGEFRGRGYYAITTVVGGVENIADFGPGNTMGPIVEGVEDPLPVEVEYEVGPGGHLFIQYMDLRRWNPTFHAPRTPDFLGLVPPTAAVKAAIQYAYDYVVFEPPIRYCGGSMPKVSLALLTILHGHAGGRNPPYTTLPHGFWCVFYVYPTDDRETWGFGFARDHDYRSGTPPGAGDAVVNFTEQRVLRMLYDLERHPAFAGRIDPSRRYVSGHSMGGSAALALALRYPDVFAAAYASQPMTNYRTVGDGGGTDWRTDVSPKWGTPALNLPVELAAPGGWGASSIRFSGMGVWDWHDHQATLRRSTTGDVVPFGLAHGYVDATIEWTTQGRPVYAALDASRQVWGGAVTPDGHRWQGFRGLPPAIATDQSASPFFGFRAAIDETAPGTSRLSGHEIAIPPAPERSFVPQPGAPADAWPPHGGMNGHLDWSAGWNPWDGAPLDEPRRWGISLRTLNGTSATVDVTPRRQQKFCVKAGTAYAWENRQVADDQVIASGTVTADAEGVVTVSNVAVGPTGNRLRISAAGAKGEERAVESPFAITTEHRGVGATSTAVVILANRGTEPIPSAGFEAALTGGRLFSAIASSGVCRLEAGKAICRLGRVDPGGWARITLTADRGDRAAGRYEFALVGSTCGAGRYRAEQSLVLVPPVEGK